MSELRRFEIWDDFPNGSLLAMIAREVLISAIRTQDVDGTDQIEFAMYRGADAWAHIAERAVIRSLSKDGGVAYHRIERKIPERGESGEQLGSVVATSMRLDLGRGLLTRSEADGTTNATFPLEAFTRGRLLDLILEQTPNHFVRGEVDDAARVISKFSFDVDSPLSALERLAEELELSIRAFDGFALVELLEQIGADAAVPEFRYAKNVLAIQRTSDVSDLVNKFYPFGVNEGGVRANAGDHRFTVDSVSAVDSDTVDVVLAETDVIAVDDALNSRGLRRVRSGVADADYLIEDSVRSTNSLRVTDVEGGTPDIQAGDQVYFRHNPPVPASSFTGNLLPDGDTDTSGWVTAPLWSKINDGDDPSQSDPSISATSAGAFTSLVCEVSLQNPSPDPDAESIHRVKVWCELIENFGPGGFAILETLSIFLRQGTTNIASTILSAPRGFGLVSFDLTPAQVASITDYTDLRLRFAAVIQTSDGSSLVTMTVYAAHLKIVESPDTDAAGGDLIFVEHPASQASYGTVIGRKEYGEIHKASNLVAGPALRDWVGGLPVGWSEVGIANIVQEEAANYTRFGGSSARYEITEADRGLVSDDIPVFPTEGSPYFSAFVLVWNESDDGLRFYLEWEDAGETVQSEPLSTTIKNAWDKLEITGLELPPTVTVVRLYVLANSTASAPWWLDAAQLTQTGENVEFIEGRSGSLLWQRAVREIRRRSQPVVAYEIDGVDLTAADPAEFPHDALTLGGDVKIVDRDLGVSEQLRLTRISRDLLTGANVKLDVETRESMWTPSMIEGLLGWYAADAIVGLSDTDAVAQWSDLTGLGNHLVQATGANQPSYRTGILAGLPVVRFDGVDDFLSSAPGLTTFPFSVVIVARQIGAGTNNGRVWRLGGNGDNNLSFSPPSTYAAPWTWWRAGTGQSVNSGVRADRWAVLSIVCPSDSPGDGLWYFNGLAATPFDPSPGNDPWSNAFVLGQGGGAEYGNVEIAEVIVSDRVLSEYHRRRLERYLGAKYKLAVL